LPPPQDRRRIPAEHEHIKNLTPHPALTGEGGKGYQISDGSRGFIFNADPKLIVDFFEIGTRPRLVADR
jgi:hypothetical protein